MLRRRQPDLMEMWMRAGRVSLSPQRPGAAEPQPKQRRRPSRLGRGLPKPLTAGPSPRYRFGKRRYDQP
jgi:hypothetical protein